ncbi:MAG: cation:proton antiporter [Erysipelotrichaceae bacterium]|nr:cation:proton antiporter [Erysipelotrichaceae bacterium]
MVVILTTAITLLAGLLLTRVTKLLHLNFPDVTVYLLTGLLVGPYCLGRLGLEGIGFKSFAEVESLGIISTVALGFIAFSIGAEFKMEKIAHSGKATIVIGIMQALMASVMVDIALIALHFVLGDEILPIPVCITLGAIASATAPAATLMVVKQYKAHGPVTDLLLPIVALDDAVGLVIFAISLGIAQAINGGNLDFISIIVNPLLEIICSIILGSILGYLLTQLEKIFFSNDHRMAMTITFVLLAIAFSARHYAMGSVKISFSSLLVLMMMGTVFCNTSVYAEDLFEKTDRWTAPLYVAFFVLSGAELDLKVFTQPSSLLIGAIYIVMRCCGKYFGSSISAKAMKLHENIVRYLGITLFPQAGVALGMVNSAQVLGADHGSLIRNVILLSVLIYELVGPSLTRMALTKAGEIEPLKEQ